MLLHGRWSPDFFHDLEGFGIVVAEFGGDEGVEVVAVEVGLGGFGEVFLMVGGGVVLCGATVEELYFFKDPFFDGRVVGGNDFLVVEAEDLVVIGVGQFVKNDGGVLEELAARVEVGSAGDVDFFGKAGIVATALQPSGAWVVLHGGQFGMLVLDPDLHFLHFAERLCGKEDGDSLQVICQHLEGLFSFVGMLAVFEKSGIDVNRPALDVSLYWFDPADFFGTWSVFFISEGNPGGGDEKNERGEETQGAA